MNTPSPTSLPYQPKNITAGFGFLLAFTLCLWAFCNEKTFLLLVDPNTENGFSILQWTTLSVSACIIPLSLAVYRWGLPASLNTQWFLSLQWIGISIVFPVLFMEMILAPFYEPPQKEISIFVKDERLGWKLKPNYKGIYGNTPVKTNSLNLRGTEIPPPKTDRTRILFLGDSVTFGLRIADENQTLPLQTASALEKAIDIQIDPINAGVPGYNSYQQSVYFKEQGIHLQPDIVVLCFVLNDVLNTYTHLQYNDYGADSPIVYLTQTPLDSLLRQSSIVQAVQYWKHQLRHHWNNRQSAVYEELFSVRSLIDHAGEEEIESAWKTSLFYLLQIVQLCRERDIPFILCTAPYRFQYKEPSGNLTPQKHLSQWAENRSIPHLDLLPALLEYKQSVDPNPNRLFQDYCHFTAEGIHLISGQIARFLIEHTMLKPSHATGTVHE